MGGVLILLAEVAAFWLMLTQPGPLEDWKRSRDDAHEYDDESEWELDYHARWNPEQHPGDDREPWGARR